MIQSTKDFYRAPSTEQDRLRRFFLSIDVMVFVAGAVLIVTLLRLGGAI